MIDTAKAKAWLKVEHDAEDDLIGALVSGAIGNVEAMTSKFLSPKAFTQELSGFPCRSPYAVRLVKGPVSAITSIFYDPADGGDEIELAEFRLVEGVNGSLQPAYGSLWPVTLDGAGTVRIIGTAGYADGEAPELDTAVLLLVAFWYQNREGMNEVPAPVEALIRPFRPVGIA